MMKSRRPTVRRVRLRYSRESRLKQPAEFRAVYDAQQKIAGKYFVLYYVEKELVEQAARRDREGKNRPAKMVKQRSRIGVCASKKIGNAVHRNRAKRILREAWRHMAPGVVRGYDIVLNGRSACTSATMDEVRLDLWKALRKLKLLTRGAAGSPVFWQNLQGDEAAMVASPPRTRAGALDRRDGGESRRVDAQRPIGNTRSSAQRSSSQIETPAHDGSLVPDA